jgi:2-isopropylmalate synthase/homocitrate synthase family protein
MKIEILDTTLRDGAQGAGIEFTYEDKSKIITALDELGVDYIEAWNFMSDTEVICDDLKHAEITAFGSTRKPFENIAESDVFKRIAASDISVVTIFGKSWTHHVSNVLKTSYEENLAMIYDTVRYLTKHGKRVIYDAEHFFDGYAEDSKYAIDTIRAACKAGAVTVVLCDTNGGSLPDVIGRVVSEVKSVLPDVKFGIHCHNDIGMAVAATMSAVKNGAVHVHGTISGIGERCGNANLNTIMPVLQFKLGYKCIPPESMKKLTQTVRYVNEIANITFDESEPFVGGYAFTHKAGMHIDAVRKSAMSIEHIEPDMVGNERDILISGIAGRAAVLERMEMPDLTKDSPQVMNALNKIREYEQNGYSYEDADASLKLLIYESLGIRQRYFNLIKYQVSINESVWTDNPCTALIKIAVGDKTEMTAAEGKGPVHALDTALRRALSTFYPVIENIRLTDYKVRVLNSGDTTASKVRVSIETTDGIKVWRTVGVSEDIIDASWQALADSVEYVLAQN